MKLKIKEWFKSNKKALLIIASVFVLDRISKWWALSWLTVNGPVKIAPFFHLTYVENTGAAFGTFQNGNLFLLIIMAIIVIFIIKSWKEIVSVSPRLSLPGISFIMAGALGNMYDRVMLGFVVDFLDFRVWPVFNIADSFICIGAGLIILGVILNKEAKEKK